MCVVMWNDEMTCCIGFQNQFDFLSQFIHEAKNTHLNNTGEAMPDFKVNIIQIPASLEKIYALEITM